MQSLGRGENNNIFSNCKGQKELSFGSLELGSETRGFIYFNMVMILVSHVYQIG